MSRAPARRATAASLTAALLALGLTAPTASAFRPPAGPSERPAFDSRRGSPPPVPPRTQAARGKAQAAFGEQATVATDPGTGGLRFLARGNGFLTAPREASPEAVVLDYVRSHPALFGLDADDVDALVQNEDSTTPDGVTHVGFTQSVGGVPSFASGIRGHVDGRGRLLAVSGGAQPDLAVPSTTPGIGAGAALSRAREDAGGPRLGASSQQGPGPQRPTTFSTGERASLVVFPTGRGARLAWRVDVDGEPPYAYTTLVDARTGDVLFRDGQTDFLQQGGDIFQRYPGATPAAGGTAQDVDINPSGGNWLNDSGSNTRLAGQNTHAYADRNANNVADAGENVAHSGGGDWLFPQSTSFPGATPCPPAGCTWDSGDSSTEATNRSQSVTNLFYHVNKFHDYMRDSAIGFDVASGNFEDADRVLAEGNDGSGLNNANFSTPADGTSGRMQMYLWTTRDVTGNDDAGIIYHEYAHGLTNRLVGGPANASALTTSQARGMGEGWSDWFGLDYLAAQGFLVDSSTVGDVVTGDYPIGPGGIRDQATDCRVADTAEAACPDEGGTGTGGYTFGDLPNRTGVHEIGEVWGQTLWDLRRMIAGRDGDPAQSAAEHAQVLRLITGGLRLAPSDPTFLEMRDAILQQVSATDSELYSPTWIVFAERGMGINATSPTDGSTTGVVEDFETPTGVRPGAVSLDDSFAAGGDGDGTVEPGERFRLRQELENVGADPLDGVSGTLVSSVSEVSIEQRTSGWPTIPGAGALRFNSTPFEVVASASAPCAPTSLGLSLLVTTPVGDSTIPLKVSSQRPPYTGPGTAESPALTITQGTPVTSDVIVSDGGTISDLNVRIEELRHTWVGDLEITLTHVDTGTAVTLLDRPGVPATTYGAPADDLLDTSLDDEAASPIEDANVEGFTGAWIPNGSLSAFDGESLAGTWRLTVTDHYSLDDGALYSWNLNTDAPDCTVSRPVAATGGTSAVGPGGAIVHGDVGEGPGGLPTSFRFVYGTTPAFGAATAIEPVPAPGASPVAMELTGLQPSTTYHYRVETLRGGTVAVPGETRTFTTAAAPPPPAPPAPAPAPAPPPAPAPAPAPVAPAPLVGSTTPPVVKAPAKLRVRRAGARDGRLDVLAEITKRATGELRAKFISGGETWRFTEEIPEDGVVKIDRKLPSKMRRARTGILEIEYEGNERVRPDDVRLRAANVKARLEREKASLKDGKLVVEGTISEKARGVVRIRYDYVGQDGKVTSDRLRAKIRDGEWAIAVQYTGAPAAGGFLSIQFTGYLEERMRGEQTSKAVP